MALTVHQEPQELTPAYNNQIFVALSTEIAQPDFKYVVSVVVNGDTTHTYTEEPQLHPVDGSMVFDAKNWVQNYIEHYFNPSIDLTSPIEIATNKCVAVEVNISEYYTGVIQSTDTTSYAAFDACLTDTEFRNYVYTDYLFLGTGGKYFLSKTFSETKPDNRIVAGQDYWLHFIPNSGLAFDNIKIRRYTAGVLQETITIATIPTPVIAHEMYVMNLNSNMWTSLTNNDQVTISFRDSTTQVAVFDFNVSTSICTLFTDYSVYYFDRKGSVPFFHFDKRSTINHTKKISEVKLGKDTLNTTTHQYGSNEWDRENHVVNTAIESTITLNTNWITQSQSEALLDLWASPIIYLWDGTRLRSVKLSNAPYDQKTRSNSGESLFNYSITVDLGSTESRQRGI